MINVFSNDLDIYLHIIVATSNNFRNLTYTNIFLTEGHFWACDVGQCTYYNIIIRH